MVREYQYTKEQLLTVMNSWLTMIKKDGGKHPTATLDDLARSIQYVLEKNRYNLSED